MPSEYDPQDLLYIDRLSRKICVEKVYGGALLQFLYGNSKATNYAGKHFAYLLAKTAAFSKFFGWWKRQRWTKREVLPFIENYEVDPWEFAEAPASFHCFNDFFIRKLKPSARPIAEGDNVAIIPADGRYLFYQDVSLADGFVVKGKKFSLETFLDDAELAKKYQHGSMAIARLCPSDYHRFHFPCQGIPSSPKLINGALWSVNPLAIKRNIDIFCENKRMVTQIDTARFEELLYIEVGATAVGSIHQTYQPMTLCRKGEEKGFFSFGGSTLVLLFQKDAIKFDKDLLEASQSHTEIRCLLGQPLGTATH
jgi:phosphatidylserine decarboxylase